MHNEIFDKKNLCVASTNYPKIISEYAAKGWTHVATDSIEEWVAFTMHPSITNYVAKNLYIENGIATFKMYGVSFSYQGD